MLYARGTAPWEDLPSTQTPVPASWYTQVDDLGVDLANTRVPALEASVPVLDTPTVTTSAVNAATSIGSPTVWNLAGNPFVIRQEGAPAVADNGSGYLQNIEVDEPSPWSIRFVSDAPVIEIVYLADLISAQYNLRVDGLDTTTAPVTQPLLGGGFVRLRFQFTARRMREIELEMWGFSPKDVVVGVTDTMSSASPRKGLIGVIGDSFSEKGGLQNWTRYLGRILDYSVVTNGSGGTGYLATSGSHVKFADRFTAKIAAATPNIVIFAGGLNDSNTGLQTAATSLFAAAHTALPNTLLAALGPWHFSSASAASVAANAVSISNATATIPNGAMPFWNTLSPIWMTGSGNSTNHRGDGTADYIIGFDGTHPDIPYGMTVLAHRVARLVSGYFNVPIVRP